MLGDELHWVTRIESRHMIKCVDGEEHGVVVGGGGLWSIVQDGRDIVKQMK